MNTILVEKSNYKEVFKALIPKIEATQVVGFDLETFDRPHPGLKAFRKKKFIPDFRRTRICGCSFYAEGDDTAYYVNIEHTDVENRVPKEAVLEVLKACRVVIAHNAAYEITCLKECWGYDLKEVICSMQLCVSAYNPDEYDFDSLISTGLKPLWPVISKAQAAFITHEHGEPFSTEQLEVVGQLCAKESRAAFSYNGLVHSIAYGYGLKTAVKQWFEHDMTTFKEVLGSAKDMGDLTGKHVADYGAEDAYWCVKLYHRVMKFIVEDKPSVLEPAFHQENPMVSLFSKMTMGGIRVNREGIQQRLEQERTELARLLRELNLVLKPLSFSPEPNEKLFKTESWYQGGKHDRYRSRIKSWAKLDFSNKNDFEVVITVSGASSSEWREENGLGKPSGPNFTHYMMLRTLVYDLLGCKVLIQDGKVQSNKEAMLKMKDDPVVDLLIHITGVEQRVKLYLNPYRKLVDPETGRMYPLINSLLASRRMAARNPNTMQLGKRGESVYVRNFFLPDNDDHLIVSRDWSQIELVIIGELSGDPEFQKCFGQIPYRDLHTLSAASCLEITPEELKARADYKTIRTELGKGANFNYWYSGALSTVGQRLGWSPEHMWAMTDKYRETFSVAESWRTDLIAEAQRNGYVTLPDGLQRAKLECTDRWFQFMMAHFNRLDLNAFGYEVCRRISSRANNQIVNSVVQGTCATLAKRTMLRMEERLQKRDMDARLMLPIHDELVYSVNKSCVIEFGQILKEEMENHKDIIKELKIHSTMSVGKTFVPYSEEFPYGQIELDEAPDLSFLRKGQVCSEAEVKEVVRYLS